MAVLFFKKQFPQGIRLSFSQAFILLGFALQNRKITEIEKMLKIEHNQILALYNKAIRRLTNQIKVDFNKKAEKNLNFSKRLIDSTPLKTETEDLVGKIQKHKKIRKKNHSN